MPDSTVPPTPPVPLSALLAREDLALRRIAGPDDPGTVVHWVHTSEMADPYPYLLGGELLLTAGVHIPEAAGSGTYFDDYVSRIVAAGGAALGFGVAPVHDTVPRALVAACERYGLPLLEVPEQTTFSGVARAVWQLMAQARLSELRRVTEAQQSLASAASRPDPVPSVLRQLAQRLGGWAVLYGPEGAEIASAGREAGEEAASALAELAGVVRPADGGAGRPAATPSARPPAETSLAGGAAQPGGPADARRPRPRDGAADAGRPQPQPAGRPSPPPQPPAPTPTNRPHPTSATDTVPGAHLAAYALGAGRGFVLGVAAPGRAPGDHTIVSVAAVLLSLLTGEQQSGTGAARSSALVRLLLGAAPEDVAPLLGDGRRWVVVHARPDGEGVPDAVAAAALGAALGSALVDPAGDVVRVLVPADRAPDPLPGWTLGVSAAVAPEDWPAADTQAARALARARATRAPLLRHGPRPALADLVPPDEAAAHARTLLAPVTAHPALPETLRTWLSLHGSWDRTAVALSVHRNTVRQRIARCATLLEADLDDPDVRMELWFALRQI
ncbi:PucR family transcriptional regulator [Streptomyces sp. HP-A2021]|uniref:PucR family transcriptional regulator n=1 Tax=Streptomyces sp. HP-A2021 TaxID=2927875 RepID=UPI001FAFD1EA|nr:PucR family transcriptional regulator [Streptomyces sp. HP-A2021]UOB12746.1 PucR family transcriptional regulator [Streptomyces sp. HP-A2021]